MYVFVLLNNNFLAGINRAFASCHAGPGGYNNNNAGA